MVGPLTGEEGRRREVEQRRATEQRQPRAAAHLAQRDAEEGHEHARNVGRGVADRRDDRRVLAADLAVVRVVARTLRRPSFKIDVIAAAAGQVR